MKKINGFSLIELLMTLTILAITLSMGVPMINNVVKDNRRVDSLNRLSANLSLARSEAIKRNRPVSLRPGDENRDWSPNWHEGWSVFIDQNNNALVDPGETLRVEGSMGMPPSVAVACPVCDCPACDGNITFNSDGSIEGGSLIHFSLTDTSEKTPYDKRIEIKPTGQIKTCDKEPPKKLDSTCESK